MKFDDEVKSLVRKRANDRCEACGLPGDGWHFHHRRPRGMGGSKNPSTGGAANAVLLHPACHERIERNRTKAIQDGWLVPQHLEPRLAPLKRHDGWHLLGDDGSLKPFFS